MPFSQYSREYTKTLTDSRGEPWKRVGWGYGQIEGQKNTQDWVVQRNYNWTRVYLVVLTRYCRVLKPSFQNSY